MNCGLSNLATLKANILPVSMQSQTSYDLKLAAIGLTVAGLFNQFCNRQFAWGTNLVDIFTGDRPQWYVSAYPIATNSDANQSPQIAAVNMRYFLTDNWTDIIGEPLQVDASKGKIHFGYTLGRAPLQVQVIYNGGYWFQTGEGSQADPNVNQPAGSTALPPEIQGAFLLQCGEIFRKMDPLGQGIAARLTEAQLNVTSDLALIPLVKQLLQSYVRFQMT